MDAVFTSLGMVPVCFYDLYVSPLSFRSAAAGPEADPEVQKANQKATDAYLRKKRVQEATARLMTCLEEHRRQVSGVSASRPSEVAEATTAQR